MAVSRSLSWTATVLLLLFIIASSAIYFYKYEGAPAEFKKGDLLPVKVNKLTSIKTQLPYSYYSLPFCKPNVIVDTSTEYLGEVLHGVRFENSPYVFQMREDQMCHIVCKITLSDKEAKDLMEKIEDEYHVNMILDNLPLAVPITISFDQEAVIYHRGFHIGIKGQYAGSEEEKYFLMNHLSFVVKFHKEPETNLARIVGFEVKPFSVKHEFQGEWNGNKTSLTTCDPHTKYSITNSDGPQEIVANNDIIFTYDVHFEESNIKWASRWDLYFMMSKQMMWYDIVNSLMIVLFLSVMVAMIMFRILYRDISKYNQLGTHETLHDETGWKLVHGDVFRPPVRSDLLCVYVGSGIQLFCMVLITMIFALLGIFSHSNRDRLPSAMLLIWDFMGLFAGYVSARLYKMFKGADWKKVTLMTAVMFPMVVSLIFFVLNALIWHDKSSGIVSLITIFTFLVIWLGISVPLVFAGGYIGFKKPAIEDPVKTNNIPRQITAQAWYLNPVFSILIGGIFQFGAVFNELFFILVSIWFHHFYEIFGLMFLVFIILIITCAEITIVLCYFQLRNEDYNWWWRSYLTAGSSALYLFLYATFFFFTKMEITKLVSGILYFGYMLISSYVFFVLAGTIGFLACLWFTRQIYSSIKID